MPFARRFAATILALLLFSLAGTTRASAFPHTFLGSINGTLNSVAVHFTTVVHMDYTTGIETADIFNVPATLGPSLRPYSTLVTMIGPTGGKKYGTGVFNLADLSNCNFSNVGFQFFGNDTMFTNATLQWNTVSDTASYTMTVSGNLFPIGASSTVQVAPVYEFMSTSPTYFGNALIANLRRAASPLSSTAIAATASIYSRGNRSVVVNPGPGPGGGGKGSVTTFTPTIPVPDAQTRYASNWVNTYSSATQTMHVECTNAILQGFQLPAVSFPVALALGGLLGGLGLLVVRRRSRSVV